jgi:hypothetical protein
MTLRYRFDHCLQSYKVLQRVYNIVMDQEDIIAADEHSIDEDRIHALMEQYIDEETAAQLED